MNALNPDFDNLHLLPADQEIVSQLLRLGLENQPVKQMMQQSLTVLSGLSWLPKDSSLALFLTDKDPQLLSLAASLNVPEDLSRQCAKIAHGSCHCGHAAESGRAVLTQETRHLPCGLSESQLSTHCAIPMRQRNKTLGVISINFQGRCLLKPHERALLGIIADTLAVIVQHSQSLDALLWSQENLERAQNIAHLGSWDWNMETQELYCSAETYRIFDMPVSDAPTSYAVFLDHVHPDDRLKVIQVVRETMRKKAAFFFEHRIQHDSGEERVVLQQGEIIQDQQQVTHITGTVRDITEEHRTDWEMHLADSVFQGLREGIMVTDANGVILRVNPAFEAITGYAGDEVIGQTPKILHSGYHTARFYEELWQDLMEYHLWRGEVWNRRKNGEVYPQAMVISSVKNKAGNVVQYVSIFNDVTEKKTSEKRIYHLAHYDVLTQLPNRALFHQRLTAALSQAKKNGQVLAVMFLDLDGFKYINDSMGHQVGDRLLEVVANRLQHCIRATDTVSRWGGDEFTLILTDLKSTGDADIIAKKILSALLEPISLNGNEIVVGASIGISFYPDDGHTPVILVQNADMAMYRAKENGKNNYQFFTTEMNSTAMERLQLENGLRKALDRQEFELHFQPLPDLSSGTIYGAEALVRWNHPERGLVSPEKFIPIAEDCGLIIPLGNWILRSACAQCKLWQDLGLEGLKVSVNLSARQFRDPSLVQTIKETLVQTGLEAKYLTIELTESSIMDNAEQTILALNKLKSIGIGLSIDDFGTGYSSLSYLKRFPIDTLKIDRSFVKDIDSDEDDRAIVKSIIVMAHNLNLRVVAEGVETYGHLKFLRDQNCDLIQGYFFSKPLPVSSFNEFALHWRNWTKDNGNMITQIRSA